MSERMKQFCLLLRFKSIQLFIIAGSVVLSVLITLVCIGLTVRYEVENEVANTADVYFWKDKVSSEQSIWYDKGIEELKNALRVNWLETQPKSVLIFVINGINATALAAARFVENQSENSDSFVWEKFSHVARLKNSCSYSSTCDAASVFKAFWSGVPLSASRNRNNNCSSQAEAESEHMRSVLRQAQLAGWRTGFVTNQRLTGATAAALYANTVKANWECDGLMPIGAIERGCADVASQLIYSETGKVLNVLLGGGRQLLNSKVPTPNWDPVDELLCRARAGRNLLRDWRNQKRNLKKRFELLQQASELSSLNGSSLDYLLGVFANADLSDNSQAPTLQLMLNKTFEVLRRPGVAYFLLVEHFIKPQMVAQQQLKLLNETLSSFLGQKDVLTLVLLNNGNYLSSAQVESEEIAIADTLQETFAAAADDEWLLQHKLQQMSSESLVFAQGPKSSLFCGVHDETYLAHALSYALGFDVFSRKL